MTKPQDRREILIFYGSAPNGSLKQVCTEELRNYHKIGDYACYDELVSTPTPFGVAVALRGDGIARDIMPVMGYLRAELDPWTVADLPPEERRLARSYNITDHDTELRLRKAPQPSVVRRVVLNPISKEQEPAVVGAFKEHYPDHSVYMSGTARLIAA